VAIARESIGVEDGVWKTIWFRGSDLDKLTAEMNRWLAESQPQKVQITYCGDVYVYGSHSTYEPSAILLYQ